jgi:hypothetical protein
MKIMALIGSLDEDVLTKHRLYTIFFLDLHGVKTQAWTNEKINYNAYVNGLMSLKNSNASSKERQ